MELTGQRFGDLTVLQSAGVRMRTNGKQRPLWRCRCACGVTTVVVQDNLTSGNTRSCGCLRKLNGDLTRTHNQSNSPEYRSWMQMIQRCENRNNPAYDRYGGRGITVCGCWRSSFEQFLADMGHRPAGTSLERRNNAEGYSLNNCRWATPTEQNRNRRDNVILELDGVRQPMAAWAEQLKFSKNTIGERLRRGWSVQAALQPVRGRKTTNG